MYDPNSILIIMQSADTSWLKTVAGHATSVLVGGMIPIIMFYLRERFESRKKLTQWFEVKYVEECLDTLAEAVNAMFYQASSPSRNVADVLGQVRIALPAQAAARLDYITGSLEFRNWVMAMKGLQLRAVGQQDFNLKTQFETELVNMVGQITALRDALMHQKIKSKKDISDLRTLPCVKAFNAYMSNRIDEVAAHPTVRTHKAGEDTKQ